MVTSAFTKSAGDFRPDERVLAEESRGSTHLPTHSSLPWTKVYINCVPCRIIRLLYNRLSWDGHRWLIKTIQQVSNRRILSTAAATTPTSTSTTISYYYTRVTTCGLITPKKKLLLQLLTPRHLKLMETEEEIRISGIKIAQDLLCVSIYFGRGLKYRCVEKRK